MKILVVEDEPAMVELLRYNLESEGFDVASAHDGDEAMLAIEEEHPDMLLLDWMLPKVSGIEICRRLRRDQKHSNLPVIMITARGEEADRVRGLDVGADDYVSKPFSPAELMARIRAVLRRRNPEAGNEQLSVADVVVDLVAYKVKRGERELRLGPTEFKLLRYFMERAGRVLTREQLLDGVWGQNVYVEDRTVDVHIRRLRKALNEKGDVDLIRTVRAVGYCFEKA
ncbi:phosphate regulon transcriptional regulator PhoB [Sneathiella sp. HT1-7]|jgi:two-component system phosphate regulon response regulator PhoB|uniref:phosphate regulon transcriptional regulator PhoB n=1 Tax=Sneathiella sp. HT1-7 TaxID=2887192 RepID=UPI001D157C27|nr:phosphate regulon transcriptional regulator PhoB [Sneathiella sp. HT1-7]MCC3305694.1 phosphate regulon transcriptional regulator PhoB [Sneathiella sp. HT1-7]